MSSLKNLHSHSKDQHQDQIKQLNHVIQELKFENNKLITENQQIEEELETYKSSVSHREKELRNNLDMINKKVVNWEKEYKELKEECKQWEQQYNILWGKYERKRIKNKRNNEEWAEIFKEFIQEIDRLKKELEAVSDRNLRLIKMCQLK